MNRLITIAAICAVACAVLAGCGDVSEGSSDAAKPTETSPAVTTSAEAETEAPADVQEESSGTDYSLLANKLHPVPDDWESRIETASFVNSVGDEVVVEKKAYEAYLKLKEDLEKEGIYVDLDSALRTVAEQQDIMDRFTEKYGAAYAARTVAIPGQSEHQTGLALDLYLIVDGKDVVLNEEMVVYTDIWAAIHEKLADYGFILRYPEDKEYITGFGYEPWHIRYIDDVDAAKEITEKGLTYEEYLGAVETGDVDIDYGSSEQFTEDEIKQAAVQVKCKFATFDGCRLMSLRYGGDETNNAENLEYINSLEDGSGDYTQVIKFYTDFHTSKDGNTVFEPDTDVTGYEWWLALDKEGEWQLLSWGVM